MPLNRDWWGQWDLIKPVCVTVAQLTDNDVQLLSLFVSYERVVVGLLTHLVCEARPNLKPLPEHAKTFCGLVGIST